MILNAMALMSENPVASKKKSLGGKMRGRQDRSLKWTSPSANDNSPSRTVAGEGVVQCLHFLASELEQLVFPESAADVMRVASALQARIDADGHCPSAKVVGKATHERSVSTNVMAPNASSPKA